MRTVVFVALVALSFAVVSVSARQSALVPLAMKAKAAAESEALPAGIAPLPATSLPAGTLSLDGTSSATFGSCFLGSINECTGENAAWNDQTATVMAGEPLNKVYAENKVKSNTEFAQGNGQTNTFALAEFAAEVGGCTGKCQNPSLACSTGYVHGLCGAGSTVCCPAAKTAAAQPAAAAAKVAVASKCPGTCQASNSKCSTGFKRGLCPGSTVCCPSAGATTPAAATPAATTTAAASKCPGTCQASNSKCSTGFKRGLCPGSTVCCPSAAGAAAAAPAAAAATAGAASKVRDPVSLVKAGRSIQMSDLTVAQQTNLHLLMDYAKKIGITDTNQKAYILGTALWESHLTPISELGGSKKKYAPYYGRGFVQLTWEYNYDAFTKLLASQVGITADLVNHRELALVPSNAAFIAVYGMQHGTFTGRKLSTYFTATKADFVGARYIINGKDKAATIASLAKGFVKLAATL